MKEDLKDHEWQVFGQCEDPTKASGVCGAPITLPEQSSKLGMRTHTPLKEYQSSIDSTSFGKPIEANLAIQMISAAHKSTKAFFTALTEIAEKEKDLSFETANNIYNLMYGVTFDKTIILKILSQPNCEGIRSYLGARPLENGELHYSLVMVGVDMNGYDLNYPPATYPPIPDESFILKDNKVATMSLSGEYGNPPGGL
ncbi:hypothetical protein [Mucilaginibacter gotjawali]|uniref:hypothetical protein n=1 Tax=Mucilaginibacter gotjawali TaxID=1550579 RepID=UPI000BBADFFE|nr:hypothetical protein [Mucilaginibacter gotjawali]